MQVERISEGLKITLLVRHPDTGQLLVNFDPRILELFREVQCFHALGLEVPALGEMLYSRRDTITDNHHAVQVGLGHWEVCM